MDLTWYILGLLTAAGAIFIWKLSKRYRLNWLAGSGLFMGFFLILFSIAWATGAFLEGVPRAASMGLLVFGLSGIIILTFIFKYINTRLEKIVVADIAVKPAKEIISPEKISQIVDPAETAHKEIIGKGIRYLAYISLVIAFFVGMFSDGKDYEAMVRSRLQAQKLTKVKENAVVSQMGEKIQGGGS